MKTIGASTLDIKNRTIYWGGIIAAGLLLLAFPLGLTVASANQTAKNITALGNDIEFAELDNVGTQNDFSLGVAQPAADESSEASLARADVLWRLKMEVDFGKDYGQNLGTLFELFDADGKVLCGAGFNSSVQTRVAINNRMLELYCRLPDREIKITDLGKPAKFSTRPMIYSFNNRLIDFATKRTYFGKKQWRTDFYPHVNGDIFNVQIIRNKPLYFLMDGADVAVSFNGKRITQINADPVSTLYYDKKVYIFARDYESEIISLYWFEWDSYAKKQPPPVVLNKINAPADLLDVYALYGHDGKLLIAGSGSRLYEFSEGDFRSIPADEELQNHIESEDSGEFYSFISYFDDILIGHYTSGLLLKYSPDELATIPDSPPLVEDEWRNGDYYYREAQSLGIYGGDLYVGMYPWGRVFRLDRDTGQWSHERLFDSPQANEMMSYPYSNTCPDTDWAQRITYLAPFRGGLAAGLGSMRINPQEREASLCIPREALSDYGRVKLLTMGASTMGQLKWTDKVVNFDFIVKENGLFIYQDGKRIARTKTAINGDFFKEAAQIDLGYGIFGSLNGTILSTNR
jgi:hypothetical protein